MIDLNKTETPEEKEALDRLSTEDFIVVGNPEKFSEFKAKWEGFDTTNSQFESLAVEVNSEPVWNVEGLPPVGKTVKSIAKGFKSFLVMGYYDDLVWVTSHVDCDEYCGTHLTLTTDRFKEMYETPEQKAAREREEEIADMSNRIGLTIQICEKLYDSGYRRMK